LADVRGELDCIVIGYNDREFDTFAREQKPLARASGAYQEVKTNSVLLHGRRLTYMDLMNHGIKLATGTDPRLSVFRTPSLGACYLTSFLRRKGHRAELVNYFSRHETDELKDRLKDGAKSVAITTTYYVDNAPIIELVKFIREHGKGTKIIVGGPHAFNLCNDYDASMQNRVLKSVGADIYVFDSQGEATLSKVVSAVVEDADLSRIPNLIYRVDGEMCRTPREVENNGLDENVIDWSVFDPKLISPTVYMRTARSCPFACSFCNYPTMAGEHVLSSVEVIIRELTDLRERGVKNVVFIDDTFNVPLPRFKKLLREMVARKLDMNWISFFRCSNADDEAFDLMKDSGCLGVFLGIESGDQTILNHMAKFARTDKYKEGITKLKERGIVTWASFIIGFPGENQETVTNTFNFIEDTGPTFFNPQLYYHDQRSPIHLQAEKFGIKGGGYSWTHNSMGWRDAATWVEKMFKDVKSSIPLTLYGFSIWSFPYLISQGISMDKIRAFGEVARDMITAGFPDAPVDLSAHEARLAAVFAPRA
jgi:p-methyltransferase